MSALIVRMDVIISPDDASQKMCEYFLMASWPRHEAANYNGPEAPAKRCFAARYLLRGKVAAISAVVVPREAASHRQQSMNEVKAGRAFVSVQDGVGKSTARPSGARLKDSPRNWVINRPVEVTVH
jgi:hypothetical protein